MGYYPIERRRTLKRLIMAGLLVFLTGTSAFAVNNFYIDAFGTTVMNTDARHQIGGGYNLGYNLLDNLNVIHRGIISSRSSLTAPDYNYMAFYFGAEYIWYFWDRLGLRSGILAGVGMIDASQSATAYPAWWPGSTSTGYSSEISDTGVSIFFNAGLQYNITQHVAAFLDMGFHYDIYSKDFENASIYGEVVMIGVRVTIGKNKKIDAGY